MRSTFRPTRPKQFPKQSRGRPNRPGHPGEAHALAAAVAAAVSTGPAFGAGFVWNNTTDVWSDPAGWTPTGPPSAAGTDTISFNGSGATAYTSTIDNNGGTIANPWVINGMTLNSTATVAEVITNSNANGFAFGGTDPRLHRRRD